MKKCLSGLVLGLVFFASQCLFAGVNVHTAQSAKEVEQYLPKTASLANTWLVFDLDDTLLTMKDSLGGVAWWEWQAELIERNVDSPLRVAKDINGLIEAQKQLFATQQVAVTDAYYPVMLNRLGQRGANLFALTARGEYFQTVTEQQLNTLHYTARDGLLFDAYRPVALRSKKHDKPFSCPDMFKTVSSQHGILYLANQNKGDALVCVLGQSKTKPSTLIFVDDSASNVQAMAQALRKYPDIDAHLILFTREHAKEAAFKSSKSLQQKAALHWQRMQAVA